MDSAEVTVGNSKEVDLSGLVFFSQILCTAISIGYPQLYCVDEINEVMYQTH